ncbi:MAG: DUF4390 domain-containing protein, partial [Desulfobulbaceae bacterium]|nr:DUF4390 domain-containing protein [Desulfobulbaceae bacterium]
MKKILRYIHLKITNFAIYFFCFAVCMFRVSGPALAEEAVINDIIVTNSSDDLLLYFIVENCFSDDMEVNIQNGLPVTFTFFINLYQERRAWPDKEIASHEFDRTLTYDNLKEEYHVIFFDNRKRRVTVESISEAKKIMMEMNGFKVTSLENLVQDAEYILEVKARLAKKT